METKLKKWYSAPANLIGLICFWRHLVALNELLNSNSRVFLLTQHYHGMHILIILWKKAAKRLYFLKVLKRSGLTSDHLLHFYVAVRGLYVQFSNIVRQFGIIIYPNISQIKLILFKREQFASYSRLREACRTYLLFLTLNYLHYNSADKHWLKNCS